MRIRLDKQASAVRAVGVLCILLILFAGCISAVHFHLNGNDAPDSACATCALIHAGVVPVLCAPPVPVLAASESVEDSAPQLHSFAPVSSLYIRPPPLV